MKLLAFVHPLAVTKIVVAFESSRVDMKIKDIRRRRTYPRSI
jgi:hypothetical protein